MSGRFVWHELVATDTAAAATFYSDLIGWKAEPFPLEDLADPYTMWVGCQGPVGGLMPRPEGRAAADVRPRWVGTVEVKDLDAILARAGALGGRLLLPVMDVPHAGRVAVLADPQGATLQVLEPTLEGAAVSARDRSAHGEVTWNELHTSDARAAFRFYGETFGWSAIEEIDMGPDGAYIVYGREGERFGGIVTLDPDSGERPAWIYYIQVDDLAGTMARAATFGARLDQGPLEVPDGSRVAHLTDPQGVPFALYEAAWSAMAVPGPRA